MKKLLLSMVVVLLFAGMAYAAPGDLTIQGNLVTNGSATVGGQLSVGSQGVKFSDNTTQTRATQVYRSPEQVITAAGSLALPHGFVGVADPALIHTDVYLICKTAEHGYSVGDIVQVYINSYSYTVYEGGVSLVPDATRLNIRYNNTDYVWIVINKSTGVPTGITNANWRAIFVARY